MIIAIIAITAAVTATVTSDREPGGESASTATVPEPAVGTQEFLDRLANQGYIPPGAVDRELLLRERAVQRGDVPAATLDAPTGGTPSPSAPAELGWSRADAASTARLEGAADRELGR